MAQRRTYGLLLWFWACDCRLPLGNLFGSQIILGLFRWFRARLRPIWFLEIGGACAIGAAALLRTGAMRRCTWTAAVRERMSRWASQTPETPAVLSSVPGQR